jgi:gliding motility-associated transport system ATP-binding protein
MRQAWRRTGAGVIEVEHLSKQFGSRRAVDDVTFQVARGEILGFLGPNGAGKTTTMRILTTFLPPSSGVARVNGYDCLADPMAVRRSIGYLPETPPVYREMTVADYLDFVAAIKEVPSKKRRAALDQALERTGLDGVRHRLIGNLSKGYRQRVGLAQALITEPPILILDEPTIGLDPNQILEVRGLIRALAGTHTVILSTHILSEVEATCGRAVIIDEGRVVAVDSIERLRSGAQSVQRIRLTVARDEPGVAKAVGMLPGIRAVLPDESAAGGYLVEADLDRDVREALAEMVVERGWGLFELSRLDMSLEEVFARLTTERDVPGAGETEA